MKGLNVTSKELLLWPRSAASDGLWKQVHLQAANMDGWEQFRFVLSLPPPLPIPTVSAPAGLNFHIKSVLAGCNLTLSSTVSFMSCKHIPLNPGHSLSLTSLVLRMFVDQKELNHWRSKGETGPYWSERTRRTKKQPHWNRAQREALMLWTLHTRWRKASDWSFCKRRHIPAPVKRGRNAEQDQARRPGPPTDRAPCGVLSRLLPYGFL